MDEEKEIGVEIIKEVQCEYCNDTGIIKSNAYFPCDYICPHCKN